MLLRELSEMNGVSGNEKKIRDYIKSEITDIASDIKVDSLGNMVAYKPGKADSPKIAVVAHMDEIGLMITKITSDGLLKFTPVGNFDHRMLVSKIVIIGDSEIKGVIGAKPIHLQSKEERKTAIKTSCLYIDIGAVNKSEAEKLVSVGDYAAIESSFKDYGRCVVKGKALDSRASCAILIDLLKSELDCSIYGVFSTMKEVGIESGGPAIYDLSPEYTIVLDGIDAELGKGAVVSIKELKTRFDEELSRKILETTKSEKMPVQLVGLDYNRSSAYSMQTSRLGNKVVKIGFPCKYMKTPVNLANTEDINYAKQVVEKTISIIGGF